MDRPAADGVLLEVREVTLRFGGVTALDDVSFDVHRGELFAIIGPNGAGKTSMFNCLNAVYEPQEGSIRLGGTDVIGLKPAATARLGIARTFQNLGLFTNLNVIDNLMLGRHNLMTTGFAAGALWWGQAKGEEIRHRRRVEEIIELLELEAVRQKPVGLLNAFGFYDELIAFNRKMAEVGFVRPVHQGILVHDTTLDGLLDKMASYEPHTPIFQMKADDL